MAINSEVQRKSDLLQAQRAARNPAETLPLEQDVAKKFGQGAPMNISRSAGMTGGVSQSQNQSNKTDKALATAQRGAQLAQAAGQGTEMAGKGMQMAGKAAGPVAGAAGAGIGGAAGASIGAVGGAIAGSVVPGAGTAAGTAAGARSGASAGSKIGQSAGQGSAKLLQTIGKGTEQAGKGVKNTAKATRNYARNLRDIRNKAKAISGKGIKDSIVDTATAPAKKGTGHLLKLAWLNLIDTWGITYFYIAFHFIMAYLFPILGNAFCKFGQEWIPKGASKTNKAGAERIAKQIEIVEIVAFLIVTALLAGIVLLLVVQIGVIVYVITNPFETAAKL